MEVTDGSRGNSRRRLFDAAAGTGCQRGPVQHEPGVGTGQGRDRRRADDAGLAAAAQFDPGSLVRQRGRGRVRVFEGDTLAQCVPRLEERFACTVNLTDLATRWLDPLMISMNTALRHLAWADDRLFRCLASLPPEALGASYAGPAVRLYRSSAPPGDSRSSARPRRSAWRTGEPRRPRKPQPSPMPPSCSKSRLRSSPSARLTHPAPPARFTHALNRADACPAAGVTLRTPQWRLRSGPARAADMTKPASSTPAGQPRRANVSMPNTDVFARRCGASSAFRHPEGAHPPGVFGA